MMSSGFAGELQHRAIMKATSRPLQTSKSNLVQLLCKSQHRPRPASRGLWEMLPKSQRRAALADKRLPLGGWTLLLMLLNAEQTRGVLFWWVSWEAAKVGTGEQSQTCCWFWSWFLDGGNLADLGGRIAKFQLRVEASRCKSKRIQELTLLQGLIRFSRF